MTKLKVLMAVLLVTLALLAGCKDSDPSGGKLETSIQTPSEGYGTVTSGEEFLKIHRDWTQRLEDSASKTEQLYNDWTGGKINTEVFLEKAKTLYAEVKQLNKETDLKTKFELSESDKQKINYEAIDGTYQKASKQLNDFLYSLPRYTDDEIKTRYEEMIRNNYKNKITELKELLKL